MLSATGFLKVQAQEKSLIRVEVSIGKGFANTLGSEATAAAIQLAESQLVVALQDKIRYFHFVTSQHQAPHRLHFRIARPSIVSNSALQNIHDYYVYLTLDTHGSLAGRQINWLFRGAASNMHGADTPVSIAQLLSSKVTELKHHVIVQKLLSRVSFTTNARLKTSGTSKGWIIHHSAKALCMSHRSMLEVHSLVPGEEYEEEYNAVVKKLAHNNDIILSITKDDISSLMSDPEAARVVAVHVLSYERKCEGRGDISETSPGGVSFGAGEQP